jgi:hypothetical protein
MATAAWEAELVGRYPAVKVHDAQTGKTVELQNVHSATSLGHQFTSTGDTLTDLLRRIGKADAEFYRGLHLWRSKYVKRRQKMRMYRRYLQILIYAGAVCWTLTRAVQKKLNHWSGAKMAAITGNSHK